VAKLVAALLSVLVHILPTDCQWRSCLVALLPVLIRGERGDGNNNISLSKLLALLAI
jgi:hypothetical protein